MSNDTNLLERGRLVRLSTRHIRYDDAQTKTEIVEVSTYGVQVKQTTRHERYIGDPMYPEKCHTEYVVTYRAVFFPWLEISSIEPDMLDYGW